MADIITRRPDWRTRLAAHLEATARAEFKPGKHDCALDAAAAVEAMTGHDFARGFRGYRTLKEGVKKLRAKGFRDHIGLAASVLEACPVAFARAGDLAVLETEEGDALCVVLGDRISVFSEAGRGSVPLLSAKSAFKVG